MHVQETKAALSTKTPKQQKMQQLLALLLQAILDDQIVKTQSMRASPFIGPLEKEALEWDETLNRLQEVVDNWLACQATWQYLEPIFTSPDIMKQMPEEGDKFLQVCAEAPYIQSPLHAEQTPLSQALF